MFTTTDAIEQKWKTWCNGDTE